MTKANKKYPQLLDLDKLHIEWSEQENQLNSVEPEVTTFGHQQKPSGSTDFLEQTKLKGKLDQLSLDMSYQKKIQDWNKEVLEVTLASTNQNSVPLWKESCASVFALPRNRGLSIEEKEARSSRANRLNKKLSQVKRNKKCSAQDCMKMIEYLFPSKYELSLRPTIRKVWDNKNKCYKQVTSRQTKTIYIGLKGYSPKKTDGIRNLSEE